MIGWNTPLSRSDPRNRRVGTTGTGSVGRSGRIGARPGVGRSVDQVADRAGLPVAGRGKAKRVEDGHPADPGGRCGQQRVERTGAQAEQDDLTRIVGRQVADSGGHVVEGAGRVARQVARGPVERTVTDATDVHAQAADPRPPTAG